MHIDGTDLVHPDAVRGDVLNGDGVGARVPLYPLLVHASLHGCNVFFGIGHKARGSQKLVPDLFFLWIQCNNLLRCFKLHVSIVFTSYRQNANDCQIKKYESHTIIFLSLFTGTRGAKKDADLTSCNTNYANTIEVKDRFYTYKHLPVRILCSRWSPVDRQNILFLNIK